MSDAQTWIIPIAAGIIGTGIGTWISAARARWQLHAETLRNSQDRRENELHRQRFTEIWQQFHDSPDRAAAYNHYADWTSAPGGGPLPPGGHSGNADDAYKRYVEDLAVRYQPAPVTSGLPVTARRRSRTRKFLRRRKPGSQVT